jgi:hypothetical protein
MMVAVVVAVIAALVLWVHHEPASPLPSAGRSCSVSSADSVPMDSTMAGGSSLDLVWKWPPLTETVAHATPVNLPIAPPVRIVRSTDR